MSFAELGLLESLQSTLATQGLTDATEIQRLALPELLAGRSVVALAETGSGKTITYMLPMLHRLASLEVDGDRVTETGRPRGLVLVPTRELAEQVSRVFKSFTHETRLRVRYALGGQKLRKSRDNVAGKFEILVATPGRLAKLIEREALQLDDLRMVVLDEADQLLDSGFREVVLEIVGELGDPTVGLFSATMPEALKDRVSLAFPDATWLETSGSQSTVATLETRHVDVPDGRRFDVLPGLLNEPVDGGTMLFANTRDQCDRVVDQCRKAGLAVEVLRGEMDPVERRNHLRAFRDGRIRFLVATDMAARGLDIEAVSRVVNVHLPRSLDNYLHRAGRTARAGRAGLVINLVTPRDAHLLEQLGDGSVAPIWPGPRDRGSAGG